MAHTYGVILNSIHTDVSKTERGAKQYATRNGYDTISIRYSSGYIVDVIVKKNDNGKWIHFDNK